ncbi:MAG: hypothetical protein U0L66_01655 [Acutalibacteraceae bacterium]|nr:hypothetical protein [Acutalibacteraceae bacterium]
MNVTTKLITTAKISNSGTFAGRPYDLYRQIRYNARRGTLQVRYIERYHPFVDDSLAGVQPRIVAPVKKSAWLFEPLD